MHSKRKVIVHYHIFKNAGTSVDRMLKESLGKRWTSWDTDSPGGKISPAEMEAFILDHPEVVAVSSHQVVPPLPNRKLDIFPIIFIRHPIDRAYSAYLFEWKKQKNSDAPVGSFDDYVKDKFEHPRRNAIEDFQTLHLANRGYENRWPANNLEDEAVLSNAKQFLLSLPFFGLVEDYEGSLNAMKAAYGKLFPELNFAVYRDNALQEAELTLADKVRRIRDLMRRESYERLILRNQMDLRLYEFAAAYMGAKSE